MNIALSIQITHTGKRQLAGAADGAGGRDFDPVSIQDNASRLISVRPLVYTCLLWYRGEE